MISEHERSTSPLHIWLHVQSALLGVIFLSTIALNSLLIFVIQKMKSRRSNRDCASYNIERSYMYLLFHLALADMLGVILNIPFDIFRNAGLLHYFNSAASCHVLQPFQLASTTAQAGTYVALSYHRFRAIVHPIRAKLTVCKSLIMIAIIWLISVCLSVPYVIVNRYSEKNKTCLEEWNAESGNVYTFAIFVVQYAGPVTLMAVFYIIIARTLHDHRVAKELVHVPTQDDVRSHRHIVKMLVTIVTVYGVCMLPHHLVWIVTGLQDVDLTVSDTFKSISYLFTYSNSVANPVVFFFYNKESRYHLRTFFRKLFCVRSMDVPFEIKKWSATWSGVSKSDSQRQHDKRSPKDHLKLDKLFPPKPGDSDLGVSLPWEAQVMASRVSSDSYRDYPSSPSQPENCLYPNDRLQLPNDTTNPFMYAGVRQVIEPCPSKTTLDTANQNDQSLMDENTRAKDFPGVIESREYGEETGESRERTWENGDGKSTNSISENTEKESTCDDKMDEGLCDEIPSDEEVETTSDVYEDDTARVQHMIERMIQDIIHELKQDGVINGMRTLDDIFNLNESSSNGEWEAMNSGEALNDSLVHLGDPGYQGCKGDIDGLRKQLESLPETRM